MYCGDRARSSNINLRSCLHEVVLFPFNLSNLALLFTVLPIAILNSLPTPSLWEDWQRLAALNPCQEAGVYMEGIHC